jgi:hypothetical protein
VILIPYCIYCGTQNSPTHKFCKNCGKPTTKPKETTQPKSNLSELYLKIKDKIYKALEDDVDFQKDFILGEEVLQ